MEQLGFSEPYRPLTISKTFKNIAFNLFTDTSDHVIGKCTLLGNVYKQIQGFNISCNEQIELIIKFSENIQVEVNNGTIHLHQNVLCNQFVSDFSQYSKQAFSFEDASSLCDKFIGLSTHEERLIGGRSRYNWFNIPNTTTSMDAFIQKVRNVLISNNLSGMCQTMNTQLYKINESLQEQDKVTQKEMQFIYTTIHKVLCETDFDDIELVMFFAKKATGNKHSILLYRDSKRQYKILIKPNVRNKDIKDYSRLKIGGEKAIKIPGVMIVVNELGSLQCVKRVVTHSGYPIVGKISGGAKGYTIRVVKSDALKLHPEILKQDGFERVEFIDSCFSDPRIIYVCDYLGERPNAKLPMQEKQRIMHQLIDKFDYDKYDIKVENVLWDKQNAHFIDCHSHNLTYLNSASFNTLLEHIKLGRDVDGAIQFHKQGAFELCLLFYKLYNSSNKDYKTLDKLFHHREVFTTHSNEELREVLSGENPFRELVITTYFGEYCNDANDLECFKGAVLEVLRGIAYGGA